MINSIIAVSSGLVTSYQKYRFRIYRENAFGTSDYSDELALAIASLPSKWAAQQNLKAVALWLIFRFVSSSFWNRTFIGYLVYIDDISRGRSYTLAYDGSSNPIRLTYTTMLLTPGKSYGFKVLAINFNGNGPLGSEAIFESWEAPKDLQAPTIGQVIETQISITWSVPVSNGGCSTTGFKLWMDDGTRESLVETAASDIEGKPYLRSYNIVFTDPTATGKSFRIRLEAFNSVGSVLSPIVSVVLAQVPATPTTGPTLDLTNTNAYQIGVNWSTVSDIGGSPITSYELQMAPPGSNTFTSLVGYDRQYLDTSYIATQNIIKGKDHKFKYKAQNAAGWSGFSSISYLRAATIPQFPGKPILLARSSTSITIGMSQTLDDGGGPILYNKLYIGGENYTSSSFTLVSAYDGTSSTYIFNTTDATPLVVNGNIYKIAYVAHNAFGDSAFDSQLGVGVGSLPPTPTNPIEGTLSIDPKLINIVWDKVTSSDLPIRWYIVQMDDELGGDFTQVYDGSNNPQVFLWNRGPPGPH